MTKPCFMRCGRDAQDGKLYCKECESKDKKIPFNQYRLPGRNY